MIGRTTIPWRIHRHRRYKSDWQYLYNKYALNKKALTNWRVGAFVWDGWAATGGYQDGHQAGISPDRLPERCESRTASFEADGKL